MLKEYSRHFSFLARSLDFLVALAIWFGLYYFRFYYFNPGYDLLDEVFFKAGLLVAVVTLYFFNRQGLYGSHRFSTRRSELWAVFRANSFAVVAFVVILYFFAEGRLSRFVVFSYYATSTVTFILLKSSVRSVLRSLRRSGRNLRYTVLVGHNRTVEDYVKQMRANKDAGLAFLGWVDSNGLAEKYNIKNLGDNWQSIATQAKPDYVVMGYEWAKAQKVEEFLKANYNGLLPIMILPDMTYSFVGFRMENLGGVPVISVNQPDLSSIDIVSKRIFDIVVSGFALIVLSPFFAVLALLIKLGSRGPIFYPQDRVGLDGHKFKMLKFRSMKVDVNDPGYGWTVKDDPRRTRLGTFIRATSIDELPQLWNVFVGDMSLVGPRPEMVFYVEKHRNEIPAYMLRHKVKVGITGWAQINGWRGDTCLQSRIECDLYYIRNWSLWLDIKIMFLTVFKGLVNKNAY